MTISIIDIVSNLNDLGLKNSHDIMALLMTKDSPISLRSLSFSRRMKKKATQEVVSLLVKSKLATVDSEFKFLFPSEMALNIGCRYGRQRGI